MSESLILAAGADPGRWKLVQRALAGELPVAFSIDLCGTLDLVSREKPAVLVLCSDLLDASVEECLSRLESSAHDSMGLIVIGDCAADTACSTRRVHLEEVAIAEELPRAVRELSGASEAPSPCAHRDADLFDFPANRPMVLGSSRAMRKVLDVIRRVASVDVTVLLYGETGTGKELIARRIHCMSHRARKPFRAVSLPAVPNELFESILFGHERGAFTGAVCHNAGAFEQAQGGTLFLDEVSSLRMEAQPKLLRAIQEKEIERVGAREPLACDVRIVAATNRDLGEAVAAQEFREDLYHRLSVVTLEVPPLRRRPEDIPQLVHFFLQRYAEEYGRDIPVVSRAAQQALAAHDWSGNVRELENRTQRALLLSNRDTLCPEDFFTEPFASAAGSGIHFGKCELSLAEVEHAYIEEVMVRTEGNQSRAAQILEIDRKTLRAKLQRAPSARAKPVLTSVPA